VGIQDGARERPFDAELDVGIVAAPRGGGDVEPRFVARQQMIDEDALRRVVEVPEVPAQVGERVAGTRGVVEELDDSADAEGAQRVALPRYSFGVVAE
jgi:hypothetical protein